MFGFADLSLWHFRMKCGLKASGWCECICRHMWHYVRKKREIGKKGQATPMVVRTTSIRWNGNGRNESWWWCVFGTMEMEYWTRKKNERKEDWHIVYGSTVNYSSCCFTHTSLSSVQFPEPKPLTPARPDRQVKHHYRQCLVCWSITASVDRMPKTCKCMHIYVTNIKIDVF